MTDEQINIKIAGLCGWTFDPEELPDYPWFDKEGEGYKHCPNYAADLNACHEFEKTLAVVQQALFVSKLSQILTPILFPQSFRIIHATARQRCEAFLRVHSQWEEEA